MFYWTHEHFHASIVLAICTVEDTYIFNKKSMRYIHVTWSFKPSPVISYIFYWESVIPADCEGRPWQHCTVEHCQTQCQWQQDQVLQSPGQHCLFRSFFVFSLGNPGIMRKTINLNKQLHGKGKSVNAVHRM